MTRILGFLEPKRALRRAPAAAQLLPFALLLAEAVVPVLVHQRHVGLDHVVDRVRGEGQDLVLGPVVQVVEEDACSPAGRRGSRLGSESKESSSSAAPPRDSGCVFVPGGAPA